MSRLDDITLGELMTLSPRTKEVQITADIHTHWYIRKRQIYLYHTCRTGQFKDRIGNNDTECVS